MLHVAAQEVKMEFAFGPQTVLCLTGPAYKQRRFQKTAFCDVNLRYSSPSLDHSWASALALLNLRTKTVNFLEQRTLKMVDSV